YKNIPFNPPLLILAPFFDLILIKSTFMIKSKLYQAISWRSFSFLQVFKNFHTLVYFFIIIYAIIMGQLKPTQRRYYVIKRHH
ncbi:hypothetical protein BB473_07410, partial [Helicobacter pylori]